MCNNMKYKYLNEHSHSNGIHKAALQMGNGGMKDAGNFQKVVCTSDNQALEVEIHCSM